MELTLDTPAVRTQLDLRAIELRSRELQDFKNFPEVQHFRGEARNGTMTPPSLPAVLLINPAAITPLETPTVVSKAHIQCELAAKMVRAWSLGTISSHDHDTHTAYGETDNAIEDHELHITERGDVTSFTTQLVHDDRIVVDSNGFWPIRALTPFDISKLCNCSLNLLVERVQKLAGAV